ncbi:DUF6468 domain-containing protein [Phenylobacterium aquaticum]|uniref:DUF6468 domain-containing protein n=1 Tax=Phenylobacterium aquaticum TaxID=1763816 RepID=UPI0026EAE9C7|nr:DUF6468 domain-containing protein [Phenylobacterium aquaticum]
MSIAALGLNLLLAALLLAALGVGFRLNGRLKALRDSHEGFARAVADLDAAAARAEQGLADLRAATDEAADELADRIEKARALTARLDRQMQGQPIAAAAPAPASPSLRQAAARGDIDLEADVERVAHRLGALLSGAREPRPRPEPERFVRSGPAPTRVRPAFEDELFGADEGARPPLKSVLGGRR